MSLVLGVDPGHSGALVTYNTDTQRVVTVEDMPIWHQMIGKKSRARIDALALADMFDVFELMGVGLMVLEAVGGRPKQSASSAFVFGYGVGLLYACGLYTRIPIETVPPAVWKRVMNIPGKGKGDDSAIMQRAAELFPLDRDILMPRGKRGGQPAADKAEAAMLAKYGGDYVLRTGVIQDAEYKLTYRNAKTD